MKNLLPMLFALMISGLSSLPALATPSLSIVDPQMWWGAGSLQGQITEATISVEAQGLYLQYDLYLTFSIHPDESNVSPFDSLEVEYLFDLPEGAIVTDSWLWMENYISYGVLMDRDSAENVYEGIVNRRSDPSILYKRSTTSYELRIFPITTAMPRKVKISYMLPMEWSQSRVMAGIPFNLIKPYFSGNQIDLFVTQDSVLGPPSLLERPGLPFDMPSGNQYYLGISTHSATFNHTLSFANPHQSGYWANYYPTSQNEGFYEMGLLPHQLLDSLPASPVLFILDYQGGNPADMAAVFKSFLLENLSPGDSFNFMIGSGQGVFFLSPDWTTNPALVSSFFNSPSFTPSSASYLQGMLTQGLSYMEDHNNKGSIVLFSNNTIYNLPGEIEMLYNNISSDPQLPVPLYIANYAGQAYDPLFDMLAERSQGKHIKGSRQSQSLYLSFWNALISAQGSLTQTDLYTYVQGGLCFDRYRIDAYTDSMPIRGTVLQTGRYYGNLPLQASFLALYQQQVSGVTLSVDYGDMQLHPAVERGWMGRHIQSLEATVASASDRSEVISKSRDHKILSFYTAFLCLEDTSAVGYLQEQEDPIFSGTAPQGVERATLTIAPNPFTDAADIRIEAMDAAVLEGASLRLYDLGGRLLHSFDLSEAELRAGELHLFWDGNTAQGPLPGGVFLLSLQGPSVRQTIRLLRQ